MRNTLNDRVDAIHKVLIADNRYRAVISARTNSEAVEGALFCDAYVACRMIQDHAEKTGNIEVAGQKLHAIRKALNVVKRRYGLGATARELISRRG